MSEDKYKQIGLFIHKGDIANLDVVMRCKPATVPYLLFKANLLNYVLLLCVMMFIIQDSFVRNMVLAGMAICVVFATIKALSVEYLITKEGLVIKTLFKAYCIPWNKMPVDKEIKIIDQFNTRSYILAREYQVAHDKHAYLTYASLWYIKDYCKVASIMKQLSKI